MDMGTAASSVVTSTANHNPSSNDNIDNQNYHHKRMDKSSSSSKLSGIRMPLLRKETSVINLSLTERSLNNKQRDQQNNGEAPLLRPESSASLEASRVGSWMSLHPSALRKCETAVGLSTLALETGRPVNRSRICSRCSSLLSLASSSRYSLAAGSFVPAASTNSQTQIAIGRFLCKLCLSDVPLAQTFTIDGCGCSYCKDVRKSLLNLIFLF